MYTKGMGLIVIAVLGVWAFATGKIKLSGLTAASTITPSSPPSVPSTVTNTKSPTSAPVTSGTKIINEVPPANVRRYALGDTLYAKFTTPIDLGGDFFQWGVTVDGIAVVSKDDPSAYNASVWL